MAILLVSSPVHAYSQFSLSTGFDYSTGKYGNVDSTEILYIPVTGEYKADRLTLALTVPYISITGPGGVVRDLGRMISANSSGMGGSGGGGAATSTNSGLGDVITAAGYEFYSGDYLSLSIVGKVKFGTADENKGLGTGENDYSAQIDGMYMLRNEDLLLATAGYKVVGAPPGISTNKVLFGSLGYDHKLSGTANAGVMFNAAQSATEFSSDQRDITLYASKKLSSSLRVQVNFLKGYSDGSPDYGYGARITGIF